MAGFWYVISTLMRTMFLSDVKFQGHRLEECWRERLGWSLIHRSHTSGNSHSKKTGHSPWGRIVLNETRLLTYISKEHLLEVIEQVICLSRNRVRTRGRR